MAESDGMRTPSQELAASIAAALGSAGLIREERVAHVAEQLAAGKLDEAEWRVLIEAGLPRPQAGESDAGRD
jgi:hypothetical protein